MSVLLNDGCDMVSFPCGISTGLKVFDRADRYNATRPNSLKLTRLATRPSAGGVKATRPTHRNLFIIPGVPLPVPMPF